MLVVWFRDNKLYKAKACSTQTWRRCANAWNEYAELWNQRFERDKNVVGVIEESNLIVLMKRHKGKPKHAPKEKLQELRKVRELMRVAPWGNWKN